MNTSNTVANSAAPTSQKWADFVVAPLEGENKGFVMYKDTGTTLTHPKFINAPTLNAWVAQGKSFIMARPAFDLPLSETVKSSEGPEAIRYQLMNRDLLEGLNRIFN